MRLFLSSYRLGNQPEQFVELLEGSKRIAIIGNAADYKPQNQRIEKMHQEKVDLETIGLKADELDLRDYFGDNAKKLKNVLKQYDAVWIRGGNVFLLRKAMRYSQFDILIRDLLHKDKIAYGGYSAAACVLAPTLKGFSIVDDPKVEAKGYKPEIIWEGLGILEYSIEPHYKSEHPESADVDKEIEYLKKHKLPYRTLRDGEALLIKGNRTELLQ